MHTFKGGAHPIEHKEATSHRPIERCPMPDELVIPVTQHLGAPSRATITKNAEVVCGQVLCEPDGFVSVPIHAPAAGKVTAIARRLVSSGAMLDCIILKVDHAATTPEPTSVEADPESLEPAEIIARIRNAGIVGLGGAAFPTHVKLSPPAGKKIETIILNGCECEPYLTADHRIMLERPADVVLGLKLLMRASGAPRGVIALEENKPDAAEALAAPAKAAGVEVVSLETKYPQGGERMLIISLIGREVPEGGLPLDVGVVVNNVATAVAVAEAVAKRIPLTERVVTVTGDGVGKPGNYLVPIGTPFSKVIEHCGGISEETCLIIDGGPMMGKAQSSLDVPVVKATSGICALTDASLKEEYPCVKCGRCVNHCACLLYPTRLAALAKRGRFEECDRLGVVNCIECGTCSYVCPAGIPLVNWLRLGKTRAMALRRKASAA